jgi:NTE family protein
MHAHTGNRSALVLSGGGAYGAYEVGVIRALVEGRSPATAGEPIDPQVFAGTSVGSFNAAILAMNKGGIHESAATLESIWRDEVADKSDGRGNGVYRVRGNPVNYFDPRIPGTPVEPVNRFIADISVLSKAAVPRMLHLLTAHSGIFDRVETLVDISAILDIDPFCRLVEKNLDPEILRASHKRLRVMATSWETGEAQEFDFRHMSDDDTWAAIRASAAIPGLFPRVKLWDQTFVDGGVVQNTPLKPALEEGANEIHVVSLNSKLSALPADHLDNTLETFSRVYTAMLSSNVDEDIASARWVNDGVEVMERVANGEELNEAVLTRFARVANVIYKRLRDHHQLPRMVTIHRYFPAKSLGDLFGMLNFHTPAIAAMIDQGYQDALSHDCAASGCVLPAAVGRAAILKAGA